MKKTIYRRKREGKTNYKKRLTLLLSKKPRLVIRKSLNNMNVQIVKYAEDGDLVVVSANSFELKKLGYTLNTGNLPAAYLTGLLAGKKAKDKKVGEVVADIGLNTPTKGSKIFAALKGVVDSGLKIPHSPDMFPKEAAIKGESIQKYFESVKDSKSIQFQKYKSAKKEITKEFEKVKSAIMK